MTVFAVLMIALFLLTSWLLCLEVYRGTEHDFPHGPHLRRAGKKSPYAPSTREIVQMNADKHAEWAA